MAASLGTSVLSIAADLSQLQSGFQQAQSQAGTAASTIGGKFKSGMKAAMLPAVAVLGAVGGAAKETIDAASDLNEQINKAGTVFGGAAKSVQDWSTKTSSAIGISQRAALEAAGTFGNMLVPMGFARGKAAEMSKGLVNLAADLASFNNADPKDVLEALRSGLSGETEPLRKFGVFLNDARLKQEAMNLGLYKGKGNLTAAAKAQATYSIILKDTKDAQGDFAKTATSAANAQRVQAAKTEDLKAKLGQGLLPAYQSLLAAGLKVTAFFAEHTTATKVLVGVVTGLAAAVVAINVGFKLYAAGVKVVAAAQWLWNAALSANPIGLVIIAIAALVAALVLAWKNSETFRDIVLGAWEKLRDTTVTVWNAVKDFISKWWPVLLIIVTGGLGAIFVAIAKNWDAIKTATSTVWNAISGVIGAVWDVLKTAVSTYFNGYKTVILAVWDAIKTATSTAWNAIKTAVTTPIDAVKSGVEGAWGAIKTATTNAWGAVKSTVSNAIGDVVDLARGIGQRVKDAVGDLSGKLLAPGKAIIGGFKDGVEEIIGSTKGGGLLGLVAGIPGRIVSAVGNLGGILVEAGKAVVRGLISGIAQILPDLWSKVSGIAGKIKDLKGPLPKDRVLLVEEGQAIIQGLQKGMMGEFEGLKGEVATYAPSIQATLAGSSSTTATGPLSPRFDRLVNIEHMEVRDAFDEAKLGADIAWRVEAG